MSIMAINNIEPYDFSNAYWVDTSDVEGIQYTLYGVVVVDTTRVAKLERSVTFNGEDGEETWTVDISSSISDPNGEHMVNIDILGSVLAVTYNVYDSSGKLIQTAEIPNGNDWDLSNAYVVYDGDMPAYGICSVYGITGTTPVVESIAIGSGMFNSGSSTDGTFPNGTSFKCGKGLSGTTTIELHKGLGDELIASATVPVR